MTETQNYPAAQSIPEAVHNTLIPESARKYSNHSKADLFDLVQKLEDEVKALQADRTELTRSVQENRRERITAERKAAEADSLLKRADALISETHCEKHISDGKLEAYENVIGLLVTGKPGMGERDKSPGGPPAGLAEILARVMGKKTEY